MRVFVFLSIILSSMVAAEDFSGSWNITYPKGEGMQYGDSFQLHLVQNGEKICGMHFGSARGGAKIDSTFGSNPRATVSGSINDNKGNITILSSQSDLPVKGEIISQAGKLYWQVLNPKKHRIRTIPKEAMLKALPSANLGHIDIRKLCGV